MAAWPPFTGGWYWPERAGPTPGYLERKTSSPYRRSNVYAAPQIGSVSVPLIVGAAKAAPFGTYTSGRLVGSGPDPVYTLGRAYTWSSSYHMALPHGLCHPTRLELNFVRSCGQNQSQS